MIKKYLHYYKRHGLKSVTIYLKPETLAKLKELAKDADKSTVRYLTRLLESHVREVTLPRPGQDGRSKS